LVLSSSSRAIEQDYNAVIELRYAAYGLADRMNSLPCTQLAPAFKKFQNARETYEKAFDRVAALKALPKANASTKDAVDRVLSLRALSNDKLDNLTTQYAQLIDDAAKYFGQTDTIILNNFYTDTKLNSKIDLKPIYGRIALFISEVHGLNDSLDSTISSIGNQDLVVKGQIAELQSRVALLSVGIAILFLASALVLSLRFAAGIARPIKDAARLAVSIAGGNLTDEIRLRARGRRDEVGNLSATLETMRGGLAKIVADIRDSFVSLRSFGEDLASSMEKTAFSVTGITSTIESVKEQVDAEGGRVREASATLASMLSSIEDLNAQISDQAASVAESSASIEEMVANIASVTRNIDQLSGSFGKLLGTSDDGRAKIAAVIEMVRGIHAQSEKLSEANTVIRAIAAQTDLLAMNAAIEAAHAGDSGRGFTVVAEEIRKLAEKATNQSEEISEDISSITESINEMVTSTETAETAFGIILTQISELNALEKEIREAMLEQNDGSNQILEALQRINDITERVKERAMELNGGSESIDGKMKDLLVMGELLRQGMDEIASSTKGIAQSANSVSDMSAGNMQMVDAVAIQVEHFKLHA
jgi:methyl-accepting chemotaxis protein